MYHAIIIEESLKNKEVLKKYKILRTKIGKVWHMSILEIKDPEGAIFDIQQAMLESEPYYFHIYDEGEHLIIVFKDKIFRVDPNDRSTWQAPKDYAETVLGIPPEQLDFYPSQFSYEDEWFYA